MTENQLNGLAEDVREEGYNSSNSMKDLVFDPVTGPTKCPLLQRRPLKFLINVSVTGIRSMEKHAGQDEDPEWI